jgi:hypothetical protein
VVEQWFFNRWFASRPAATQAAVRAATEAGQLIFANGGLVMHDEACPTYLDMLDQTTAGARRLLAQVGPAAAPRVSSQLDPFGHSATHASLFAAPVAGNIATFFARMDYEEAGQRANARTPDFAWMASPSLGTQSITLGVYGIQDGYSTPDGLCFDSSIECYPFIDPVIDDAAPDAVGVNVDAYVALLLGVAAEYRETYPTDPDGTVHLPMHMGDDFQWENARQNTASLDRLIHYVNANTSQHGVNIFYSTQATYAASRIASATPLQLRIGDAFPYGDGPHALWSGYFTSRPGLKGYVRDSSAVFQAAKQLQAWTGGDATGGGYGNPLWLLETAMGVAQHHDAVSGTSKQVVAYDYASRLAAGRVAADAAMSGWLNTLVGAAGQPLSYASCDLANATICPSLEAAAVAQAQVALVLYNSQGHARTALGVRVPVGIIPSLGVNTWRVTGSDGATPITAQVLPVSAEDGVLRSTYYGVPPQPAGGPADGHMAWLAFQVASIPAAGYVVVFLTPAASAAEAPHTHASTVVTLAAAAAAAAGAVGPSITNGRVTLSFDAATGLLASFAASAVNGGAVVPLSHNLLWYASSVGDVADSQCSGAYILRVADNTSATPVAPGAVNVTLVTGPVVSEARQVFAAWGSQVVRLWANATAQFDTEWTVGPIPVGDGVGKEVISRFTAGGGGWDTNATWASDANGREMQVRRRNYRPQYPLNVTEFVAQNYFPVTVGHRTADLATGVTMAVFTDRAQGGGSLVDGALELMVHRRITHDDSRGVLEPLNEPGVDGKGLIARGVHTVVFSAASAGTGAGPRKAAQQAMLLPAVTRVAQLPAGTALPAWASSHATTYTALAAPLPPQVELVSVQSWNATSLLVRLAHLYEAGEDPGLSANATVALASLFASPAVKVAAATEMNLPATAPLAAVPPVTYKIAVPAAEAAARLAAGDARIMKAPAGVQPVGGSSFYEEVTLPVVPPPPAGAGLTVTVTAMQVRTFLLQLQ